MRQTIPSIVVFMGLLILSSGSGVSAKPPTVSSCPIQDDTNIALYSETGRGGVGTSSKSWMVHFLEWWQAQDPDVNYVELDSGDVKEECDLTGSPNLELYIQPGGDAYLQQKKLGQDGKDNIINFLHSGGAYFGVCAGWYYAATDYYWEGSYYSHPYMLRIYNTVEGSIWNIANYPDYTVTPLSNGRNAIYYGGPTVGWKDTIPGNYDGIADATFSAIDGELPAVIKYNKLLLTSVHLEA